MADKPMVLMTRSTAGVECFEPSSEKGWSHFYASPPGLRFDLYENRKDQGQRGCTPDGAQFNGSVYDQLRGRVNYVTYGPKLTPPVDLITCPKLASLSAVAANLPAHFLAGKEIGIKNSLLAGNMTARKLVNAGTNGLDWFEDAYQRGATLVPDSLRN